MPPHPRREKPSNGFLIETSGPVGATDARR